MRGKAFRSTAGLAGALALAAGLAAPAAADPGPAPGLHVWEQSFQGRTEHYAEPGTACTATGFVVGSQFNNTPRTLHFFRNQDCSDQHPITIPAWDLHSFPTFAARAFRVIG